MVYIPDDWIINKKNRDHIHELLNKVETDVIVEGDSTLKEVLLGLKDIGESKIIEKIEDGTIIFGG